MEIRLYTRIAFSSCLFIGTCLAALAAGQSPALAASAGSWTLVPDNGPVTINMALTLLADGRALMTGGGDSYDISTEAQIFDPKTNTWTTAAPMLAPLDQHTATLLADGTVLVAGGTKNGVNVDLQAQAEIYDPAKNTWTFVGKMQQPRFDHMAILLKTGMALICGGTPDVSTNLSSCELYDPTTRKFKLTGDMGEGRRYSALVTLPNGDILTDGDDGGAEVYAVASGTWHAIANTRYTNFATTLTLLNNGTVMQTPSSTDGPSRTELYDPVASIWHYGGAFPPLYYNAAAKLPNGMVLSAGGCYDQCSTQNLNSAYLYHPASRKWTQVANLNTGREDGAAVAFADGRVMVVGGFGRPEIFKK